MKVQIQNIDCDNPLWVTASYFFPLELTRKRSIYDSIRRGIFTSRGATLLVGVATQCNDPSLPKITTTNPKIISYF